MANDTGKENLIWQPARDDIERANATALMREQGLKSWDDLHAWSVSNRGEFWEATIRRLGVRLRQPYSQVMDLSRGVETPRWLVGARLNIAESCFGAAPDSTAIVFQAEGGPLRRMTVRELEQLTNRVANGLVQLGLNAGDAIAIDMPMTAESVAIYLGIVKMGGAVVSIADSFAPREIETRIRLGGAKAVFTQDVIVRGGKMLPLYEKVVAAHAPPAIVLGAGVSPSVTLREGDRAWNEFLSDDGVFEAVARDPHDPINILFSSGTTGEPKTIPWNHTTAIKCAADALWHHDTHAGDVLAWPTNLGWMMGPWLIFAALMHRATIALHYGAPATREFGEFIRDANVTMLGLVPSLVKAWRATRCMDGLDWRALRLFSSTGECSNADDYAWLMSLGRLRPVVEYCGGTEIGGGYISGTLLKPFTPSTFNTLSLGIDAVILDEDGKPTDNGELFLVPPSIGLSTELLHRDHHEVYYEGVPPGPNGGVLRRHGDQMERLPNGYWRAHGRVDDTMNLGGIKVSSAEIERTLNVVPNVVETAAIAMNPAGGGPSLLVIHAVCRDKTAANKDSLLSAMQAALKRDLNPLFKIQDVVIVDSLPRTASNKVMRRVLRKEYENR